MREPSALLDQSHYVNQLVHAIGVFWLPSPNLPTAKKNGKLKFLENLTCLLVPTSTSTSTSAKMIRGAAITFEGGKQESRNRDRLEP